MTAQARAERLRQIQARKASLADRATTTGPRAEATPAGEDQQQTTAELWLYGVVGGYWFGFNAKSVADQLRGLDVDALTVRLHSPGGDALDGIAIGNLLRNHKARVTVVIDGLAASAASVIAIAGDEVVMSPGAQLMIHDPWMLTVGNAAELRDDAAFLDKQADNYAGVYAHRAGGDAAKWRAVMLADTWYSAEEAVSAGLADRVGTVPANSAPPVEPDEADLEDDEMAARAAWDLDVLVHPAARAAWHPSAATGAALKPPSASAVGSPPTREGSPAVAFSDEQVTTMRQRLGVAEDADEATILAALDEVLDEQTAPPANPKAQIPEGHVVIPAAKLADLEAGAALGTQAAERLRTQERTAFLDSVRTKYAPTNRAAWEQEYDRDPEGTRAHFAQAPELVPVAELGHAGQPEASEDDALYAELFGTEKAGA
jgi:ATP-dependent protease ClpP protease subunit